MAITWNTPTQPTPAAGGIKWNNPPPPTTGGQSAFQTSQGALGHSQGALDSVHNNGNGLQPENPVDTIGKAAGGALNQIGEGFNQTSQSQSGGFMQGLGNLGAGALKMGAGAMNLITSPFAPMMRPVGDAIQKYADTASNNPGMQQFAMSPAGEATSKVAENVQNAATIAGGVAGVKAAPQVGEAAGELGQRFVTTPEEAAAAAKAKIAQKVQGVADEWSSPTVPGKSKNPATFAKAADILKETPDTPKFLAEQKLSPWQNIEGGRYATADTAERLRETGGKLSVDALRPSLQMADYITAKTPIADLVSSAIKDIKNTKGITPDAAEAQIKLAQDKGEALQRKYSEGMGLTNMLDESIAYGKGGKFSPVGDLATNKDASVNRSFNRVLGDALEAKSPKDLPVKDFRAYQSKYYKAADYLDEINNKKAPVSPTRAILNKAAAVAGAAAGHGIGGGILGGVGGYMIGGALEHALENMTLPMRDSFLRNLKVTNPEAYTKVSNYLGKQQANAATITKLLPGRALGTPENPHLQPKAELGTTGAAQQTALPKEVHDAINNHLTSAEQILKEMPDVKLPDLLERTKTNLADGLEAQGFKAIADHIRNFDLKPFTDFQAFKAAILDYIKNMQPGLSMKSVAPTALNVAKKVGGEDIRNIQDFVADPSANNYMRLQPILETEKGLDNMNLEGLQNFLKEVMIERNNPNFGP